MAAVTTQNSDLVSNGQGTPSVYPGTVRPVYGSVTLSSGSSYTTTSTIVLFTAPGPNTSIVGFWLDFPAGTATPAFTLTDGTNTIATMTTTTFASGGFVDETSVATHGKIGVGVQYTTPTTIKLVPTTGSTATVGASDVVLYFNFDIANY